MSRYPALLAAARGRRYPTPSPERHFCRDCKTFYTTAPSDPHTLCPSCHADADREQQARWEAAGLCLDCGGWPEHGPNFICDAARCAPPRCWIHYRCADRPLVECNDGTPWGFPWPPLDAVVNATMQPTRCSYCMVSIVGCYYACAAHLPLVFEQQKEGVTPCEASS